MSWSYGPLASEVYDLVYPTGFSLGGDLEYYLGALAELDGPVLEPAVGGGRFLIPLLTAGHRVTGYDISAEMLAICHRRLEEHGLAARVELGDMTTWVESATYAAVVVPTGSIVLLDGRAPTLAALKAFAACLRPGGMLMLDVPLAPLLAEPDPLRTWSRQDTVWTLQTMGISADAAANQTTSWLRYERWVAGALDASELVRFRLQHWSVAEVEDLLRTAGLIDVVVSADHGAAAPGPDTELLTVTAHVRG